MEDIAHSESAAGPGSDRALTDPINISTIPFGRFVRVLPRAPGRERQPIRYDLPFLESRQETPTTMTFRFSTRGTDFRYRSNQAIRLILPNVHDPWGPARSFSLSSSPTEDGWVAVTAKMTGSPFKEGLRALEPGDRAWVLGPLGDLLYDPTRPSLFIAGGIGITPFRGMMRYAADTGVSSPIRLLYSARVPEEFAFASELDKLSRSHPHFQIGYTVTRPGESETHWSGRTGRIDEAWIHDSLEGLDRPKVYVVGLPEMVQDILRTLRHRFSIIESDLEYEFFRGY